MVHTCTILIFIVIQLNKTWFKQFNYNVGRTSTYVDLECVELLEERLRQEDELIVTDVEQFQVLQTGKHGRVERRDVVMSEQQLAKCSEPLEGAWSDALDAAVAEYQGAEASELVELKFYWNKRRKNKQQSIQRPFVQYNPG